MREESDWGSMFLVTPEEIACACQGKLPVLAVHGLALFNAQEFFEAHEALELAWREEAGPVRELYRGILQIAVAYYHIRRGNYRGAVKMFHRARTWLDPFPGRCCGINLEDFRAGYQRVEASLRVGGAGHIDTFDFDLFRPIQYEETA